MIIQLPHIRTAKTARAQDGAEPSAVSVSIHNLRRLAHLAEDRFAEYESKRARALGAHGQLLASAPFALATMVGALVVGEYGAKQVCLLSPLLFHFSSVA